MTERLERPRRAAAATALLPPRLVVYESPGLDELLEDLACVFPAVAFEPRSGWELAEEVAEGVVPVWHWTGTIDDLASVSNDLLRKFAYPLLADGHEFVISFSFARQELLPRALDPGCLAWLDVEDIGRLVTADAIETRFDDLRGLPTRIVQTPIEEQLERALLDAGLSPRPQAKFDRFRLDFLIERNGRRVGVEADGREFHDSERDRKRDEALLARGLDHVFRFTGSAIFRDAASCATMVRQYFESSDGHRPRAITHGRLDDSQRTAVNHGEGPARVLAPAGSGKTRVLVQRVAALVDSGIDPSTILALAFNRKAYEQLVERLDGLGIPTSPKKLFDPTSPGVVCAGFNAFGFRYQRELLDLDLRLEPSGAAWRDVMSQALRDAGVTLKGTRRGSDPIGRFLDALARVRADFAQPDDETVELEYFGPDRTEVVPFAPVLEHFERRRQQLGAQSFDDQLAIAVIDLLGNVGRRHFVQSHFRHVLVDEYQDLNGSQLALLDVICRPWRSLFAVGDDDQLIYGWRFAKLTNILDFHERMPPEPHSHTYTLGTNYRSSQAIVEASRRLIDHNERRVAKDIRPGPEAPPGEVLYERADSWLERSHAVVSFLQAHRQATRRWRDLAVLCRYKAQQPLVALALDRAGIPRSPLLAYRLFSDQNVRLLRAYVDLVRAPKTLDGDSFRLLLNRPNRYLPNELVERVLQAEPAWDEIVALAGEEGAAPGLVNLKDRVSRLREKYRKRSPSSEELLDDVILTFSMESYWTDEASPGPRRADDGNPLVLVDLLRFYAAEIAAVSEFLDLWDSRAQQEERRFGMTDDTLAREQPPEDDHVVIGTIHSSKGREYDAVVLLDYDVDLTGLATYEVEEERRVFYVGFTRARNAALVTIDGRRERVHRFVRETLRPAEPDERQSIRAHTADLRRQEEDLVIERARAQAAVDAVYSGDEIRELERRLQASRDELAGEEEALAELDDWLREGGVRGAWRRVSRQRRNVVEDANRLKISVDQIRATIDTAERRVLLMQGDPDLAAAPAREEVQAADSERARILCEIRVLKGRLLELDLLKQFPGMSNGTS